MCDEGTIGPEILNGEGTSSVDIQDVKLDIAATYAKPMKKVNRGTDSEKKTQETELTSDVFLPDTREISGENAGVSSGSHGNGGFVNDNGIHADLAALYAQPMKKKKP